MRWIVDTNPKRETWRLILEFSNVEYTINKIASIHGEPKDNRERANYKKQALQIRSSILQAKEYFDVAERSSYYTKPNHLYYGIVCLGMAMMLLYGNGNYSLDKLRNNHNNRSHGLRLLGNICESTINDSNICLDDIGVEVLNEGGFPNWYKTLPNQLKIFGLAINASTGVKNFMHSAFEERPSFEQLRGRKFSVRYLLSCLPEIYAEALGLGIDIARSKISTKCTKITNKTFGDSENFEMVIHGTSSKEHRERILDNFKVVPSEFSNSLTINRIVDSSAIISFKYDHGPSFQLHYPVVRRTMSCSEFIYEFTNRTCELSEVYLLAFILSMLSRYYPDVWYKLNNDNSLFSLTLNRAIDVYIEKFPSLALSQMHDDLIIIWPSEPFWH